MSKKKAWHWPFLRTNFGGDKEYACEHGIGHGGMHGCDGCCKDANFPRGKQSRKKKEPTIACGHYYGEGSTFCHVCGKTKRSYDEL